MLAIAVLLTVPALTVSQHPNPEKEGVDAAIRLLGSNTYQERQRATEWLQQHPIAAPAVRVAAKSVDREVAGRAAAILEYYDLRPIRELHAVMKNGKVEDIVELLVHWKKGDHENEVWGEICGLNQTIIELHKKNGGKNLSLTVDGLFPPTVSVADHYTEAASPESISRFVRATDVLWRASPGCEAVIVAKGSVRIETPHLSGMVIANGPVQTRGSHKLVLIANSDVVVNGYLRDCIIIARGTVTVNKLIINSRVICGKSLVCPKQFIENSIITENEQNPLGFIHWSDPPKAEVKKK